MKHSRRMFAFLLALCLMLSGMAAAGGARADDVVSLSYYYSVASSPDVMMVQSAINEITRETIGAEVKLYPIHPSDYVQKMQVMLSAGEELDLCFTADWKLPYTSNATKGCFADITDLLPELAPVTWSQYSEDLWNAVRINGRIYASINRQVFARQSGFALRQDMVEKYNFDAKAVTKLSDLGDFMALVKEGEDPAATQRYGQPLVFGGVAQAVYAAYRGHDNHIAPLAQPGRGAVAHPVDLVVDRRVLLDERVGRGNVGLGLIIVVIADEIAHRAVREELAELAGQLRRQRLVVRDDQRRPLRRADDIGHGERLARSGHAQQHLIAQPVLEALRQLLDGLRLIPLRLKPAVQFKHRRIPLLPRQAVPARACLTYNL